jgi:hypothetical protein
VDEAVAVLDLAKKSNGDELFAEREASVSAGPERHANEVRREEPIFGFLVAQVRQNHRPVADRLEARRGEAAVRVHRHVELCEDQDRTSRGVTCTATASPTPWWSRVTAPVLSPSRSRVTATSAVRLRLGQSVPVFRRVTRQPQDSGRVVRATKPPKAAATPSSTRRVSARDFVEAACELSRGLSREPSAIVLRLSRAAPASTIAWKRRRFVLSRARFAASGATDARAGDVVAPVLGARPSCRAQEHANLDRADVLMCCSWG